MYEPRIAIFSYTSPPPPIETCLNSGKCNKLFRIRMKLLRTWANFLVHMSNYGFGSCKPWNWRVRIRSTDKYLSICFFCSSRLHNQLPKSLNHHLKSEHHRLLRFVIIRLDITVQNGAFTDEKVDYTQCDVNKNALLWFWIRDPVPFLIAWSEMGKKSWSGMKNQGSYFRDLRNHSLLGIRDQGWENTDPGSATLRKVFPVWCYTNRVSTNFVDLPRFLGCSPLLVQFTIGTTFFFIV
jgi:hypothetical protein